MSNYGEMPIGDGVPKYAVIEATPGDNELVAAVSGKSIKVFSYVIIPTASTATARFESGAGGTALTGVIDLNSDIPMSADFNPGGHFQTEKGDALSLEVANNNIRGHLTYMEVDA